MSNAVDLDQTPEAPGGTERKVTFASLATFVGSLAGLTVLQSTVTDLVPALPDALESVGYAALTAAVTWVGGYVTKSRPAKLSQSTIDAATAWLRRRLPRYPGN